MESLPRLLACGHRSLGLPEGVYIKLNISGLISSSIYRTLDSELEISARTRTLNIELCDNTVADLPLMDVRFKKCFTTEIVYSAPVFDLPS
ncbi:hypothetical protein RRG08_049107 [Elysia crispata]|uniref:Uncharacterized protein n=1 Tax=Elysia crispata TaxID=231223 RepID=A0AAE0YV83_9GAST|nr:hypothetical protein RRG08_049107 [Elysia crispata]